MLVCVYITHRVIHIVKLCCTIYSKYLNKNLINKVSTN